MRTPFTGCGTALVTPFDSSGAVDEAAVGRLARRQIEAGIHFLVPCGTTGETPTLSDAEYKAVVTRVTAIARPLDLVVIPGAGSNSTAHALELHRFVAGVGADASLDIAHLDHGGGEDQVVDDRTEQE